MIIIDPDLTEEDAVKENQIVLDLITSEDGEITETEKWGKRRLAYEIQKKREGYYFLNYFTVKAEGLPELERHYRLNEKILRYNILSI